MSRRTDLLDADFPIGEDGKPFCYVDYVARGLYGVFTDQACSGEPVVRARTVLKLMDHLTQVDLQVVIAPFVEVMWSLEFSDWSEVSRTVLLEGPLGLGPWGFLRLSG